MLNRKDSHNVRSALLVVTSHTKLGNTEDKTGFWFEELATPFWGFWDAGYDVAIASIKGGKAHPDPLSLLKDYKAPSVDRFMTSDNAMQLLEDTLRIDEVSAEPYTTLFLCGGHGTLWDFKQSSHLARVVSECFETDKLIGSVCHGPTGLLSATKADGSPLVKGMKLTSFTDCEEQLVPASYQEALPYHLEDALRSKGAEFIIGSPGSQHVVVDQGLVTGQNPQSSALATRTILDTLDKHHIYINTDHSTHAACVPH